MNISYKPLRITLAEKDLDINILGADRGGVLNKATVSKLRHDRDVHISTLGKVCDFLDVPIEKVVVFTKPNS